MRTPKSWLHDAPISPAAACKYVTLRCGTIGHRTSAGAIFIAEGFVSCGVPAVLRNIRCGARTPPQRSCWSLGDQVRARCSLCALLFSTCTPSTACDRVGAGFAQNWRCTRRSFITLRTAHASQGGHHLARTGTNARLCRPAALAECHSFQRWTIPNPAAWRRVGGNLWRGASDSAGNGGCGTAWSAGNVQCHFFAGAALPTKTYCNAPISADTEAFAAFEALGSSSAPCGPCPGAGKCCRAERVGAGAAGADMQRERCCTGAYFAQKWWRICFGGVWDVCRVRDAKQQLGSVASCPAAGKCCRWEQPWAGRCWH